MSITSSGLPDVNLGPLTTPFSASPGCLSYDFISATSTGTTTVTYNYESPGVTLTPRSTAVLSAIYLNGGGFSTDRPFFTSIDPAVGCYPSQQRWLPDYISNGSAQHVYYSPATCPQSWTRTLAGSDVTNGTTYTTEMCCQPSLTPTTSLSAIKEPGPVTSSVQISIIWYCITVLTTQTIAYGVTSSVTLSINQQSSTTSFSAPGLFVKYQAADILLLSSASPGNGTVSSAASSTTASGRLSTAATIGIGVGVGLSGLVMIAAGILVLLKFRRTKDMVDASRDGRAKYQMPEQGNSESRGRTLGGLASLTEEVEEKDAVTPGDPRALMLADNEGTIAAPTDPRMLNQTEVADEISAAPVDPRRTISAGERIFGSSAAPVNTDGVSSETSQPALDQEPPELAVEASQVPNPLAPDPPSYRRGILEMLSYKSHKRRTTDRMRMMHNNHEARMAEARRSEQMLAIVERHGPRAIQGIPRMELTGVDRELSGTPLRDRVLEDLD